MFWNVRPCHFAISFAMFGHVPFHYALCRVLAIPICVMPSSSNVHVRLCNHAMSDYCWEVMFANVRLCVGHAYCAMFDSCGAAMLIGITHAMNPTCLCCVLNWQVRVHRILDELPADTSIDQSEFVHASAKLSKIAEAMQHAVEYGAQRQIYIDAFRYI